MPTSIDLRLSRAFLAGAFDGARVGDLSLAPSDEAVTVTALRGPHPWSVERVHLRERLGELFRCEVLITRQERFRSDPSAVTPPRTVFDDLGDALDDGVRDPTTQEDDLQSVDDNLDGALGGPWSGIPAGVVNAINSVSAIADQAAGDIQSGLGQPQGIERYLLGIAPPTPWAPETPPRPAAFLDNLHSVLISRVDQTGVRVAGRWITGLVTEFEDLGVFGSRGRLVRLVIEPQLARLALRTSHRVFERRTALQIVQEIFGEAGIYPTSFVPPLSPSATRAYCVQYGETDLELVMRLFSEEGWVPVFEHQLGVEQLKLVTPLELRSGAGAGGYGLGGSLGTLDAQGLPRVPDTLHCGDAADAGAEELLWDFSMTRTVAPTKASVRSTNFSLPAQDPALPTQVVQGDAPPHPNPIDDGFAAPVEASLHFFPGRTSLELDRESAVQKDAVHPADEARLELLAARAQATLGRGRSNAVGLAAGQRVEVANGRAAIDPAIFDPDLSPFGAFLIARLELLAESAAGPLAQLPLRSGAFAGWDPTVAVPLESIVEAVPASGARGVEFVPPRRRPPRIGGVQTVVTRASPSEWRDGHGRIGVDPIGRVRGSLHWDRRAPQNNEQPLSPPIRLAGPWADHGWGWTFLPREGMELLVAFVDGDPKQPIALGAVHGFVRPAPLERPHIDFVGRDNHIEDEEVRGEDGARLHYDPAKQRRPIGDRHINLIRTEIHPAPQEDAFKAFHELSFDDTPGRERVRVHSAGVLHEEAGHDQRTYVGRDQMNVVQGEQTETVEGSATLVVEGKRTKVVRGDEDREVVGDQSIEVRGMKTLVARANLTRHVGSREPSKDVHRIGLKQGDGVLRLLESRRDRKTTIQGDDERKVGGDVDVKCGGIYELGGNPLDMKSTAPSGPGLAVDEETGVLTLDGGAGTAELVADGKVHVRAETIDLEGATRVRFECGEVSMDLSADELVMRAPGRVSFYLNGRPAPGGSGEVPASSSSLVMDGAGEIVMKLSGNDGGGGRFAAVLRAGAKGGAYLDADDALEGGPGVKIDPVDSFQIQGGVSRFSCRRVEWQRSDGAGVIPDETPRELRLLARIAELKKEVERLSKEAARAVAERDRARRDYEEAAKKRREIEAWIREDDGIDEELGRAIDEVKAAEKALQQAKQRERRAQEAYRARLETGQEPDDEEAELDAAKEEVEDARERLDQAEEQLEETREEHGGLMDEYVAAREEEERKAEALAGAQREVVRTENELREAERELAKAERTAAALELDLESEPSAEAAE